MWRGAAGRRVVQHPAVVLLADGSAVRPGGAAVAICGGDHSLRGGCLAARGVVPVDCRPGFSLDLSSLAGRWCGLGQIHPDLAGVIFRSFSCQPLSARSPWLGWLAAVPSSPDGGASLHLQTELPRGVSLGKPLLCLSRPRRRCLVPLALRGAWYVRHTSGQCGGSGRKLGDDGVLRRSSFLKASQKDPLAVV